MRHLCSLLFLCASLQIFAQEEREIKAVLDNQIECWNEGDIECFMDGYWKSDKLVFIGSQGLDYGWQTTLDSYKKRYPTREAMGTFSFEIVIIEPLSEDFWFVVGEWALATKSGSRTGHSTLIFRKLDNDWVIVSDHSS